MSAGFANTRRATVAGGFTLVELLVVITIIGIMTSMSLMALVGAREAARRAATQSTVYKLHNLVLNKWEEYRTRRIPVDTSLLTNPRDIAHVRLDAIRELMRMELPERWTDVVDPPITAAAPHTVRDTSGSTIQRPSISQAYLNFYTQRNLTRNVANQGAVCLYLIVTKFCDDGRDAFQESEIGSVNSPDNLPVFVDGWRNPIKFLRWAPGFHSSSQTQDPRRDPDPFDNASVDYFSTAPIVSGGPARIAPYALYPLIYSAGGDGQYGIANQNLDNNGNDIPLHYRAQFNDPYVVPTSPAVFFGTPVDSDNAAPPIQAVDNIDNQSIGGT